MKERLLISVCGRAGSKGFANKNLKNFCGHPLVYYTLSAAELFAKAHPEVAVDIADDAFGVVEKRHPELKG